MKYLRVNTTKILAVAGGVLLVGGLGSYRAQADTWDKKTLLTVSEPVQVTDRLLEPGTYVLRLLESNSDRHIVQIFNEDQTHIIDTVMAIPNYRLQPTGHSRFQFWETPPGHAKALRAWFYPGDNFGQEFLYPKKLAAIETASMTITRTPMAQPEGVATVPAAPSNGAASDVQQPSTTAPTDQSASTVMTHTEVARAEPPPTPLVPETAAAPEPVPAPALATEPAPQDPPAPAPQSSLPKTASNYPAIGLAGLLMLGASALLRARRPAGS